MKKFFSKIAQRAFALAISIMVVTNTFAQGAAAVRVYLKWNSGDQDVQKAVMGWMGSCIFLVVSGVVVKAFFGI